MLIYLYIKRHRDTGLKYFGKTTRFFPLTYHGGGKLWRRHLKNYGKNVETILFPFLDEVECQKFALEFSHANLIVESVEWANQRIEDGMFGRPVGARGKHSEPKEIQYPNGRPKGSTCTELHKLRVSEGLKRYNANLPEARRKELNKKNSLSTKGVKRSAETRARISAARKGKPMSQEQKAKISATMKAKRERSLSA